MTLAPEREYLNPIRIDIEANKSFNIVIDSADFSSVIRQQIQCDDVSKSGELFPAWYVSAAVV